MYEPKRWCRDESQFSECEMFAGGCCERQCPAAGPSPEGDAEGEEEGANEEGKQPSFCVLLHGSLKVEGMVALCQLG